MVHHHQVVDGGGRYEVAPGRRRLQGADAEVEERGGFSAMLMFAILCYHLISRVTEILCGNRAVRKRSYRASVGFYV